MAYFSNGSEGEVLDEQCADCPLGYGWKYPRQGQLFVPQEEPRPCPTALVQIDHNYDQVKNEKLREAMDKLIATNGECLTRKLLLEIRQEEVDRENARG